MYKCDILQGIKLYCYLQQQQAKTPSYVKIGRSLGGYKPYVSTQLNHTSSPFNLTTTHNGAAPLSSPGADANGRSLPPGGGERVTLEYTPPSAASKHAYVKQVSERFEGRISSDTTPSSSTPGGGVGSHSGDVNHNGAVLDSEQTAPAMSLPLSQNCFIKHDRRQHHSSSSSDAAGVNTDSVAARVSNNRIAASSSPPSDAAVTTPSNYQHAFVQQQHNNTDCMEVSDDVTDHASSSVTSPVVAGVVQQRTVITNSISTELPAEHEDNEHLAVAGGDVGAMVIDSNGSATVNGLAGSDMPSYNSCDSLDSTAPPKVSY